jgi:hypothetical protein
MDNTQGIQNYVYRVALDETPLNMNHIVEHTQKIYAKHPDSMKTDLRKFAEEKLDMSIKMKELTAFLEG